MMFPSLKSPQSFHLLSCLSLLDDVSMAYRWGSYKKRYQRQISLIPQGALLVLYFNSDIMSNNWAATFLLINLSG